MLWIFGTKCIQKLIRYRKTNNILTNSACRDVLLSFITNSFHAINSILKRKFIAWPSLLYAEIQANKIWLYVVRKIVRWYTDIILLTKTITQFESIRAFQFAATLMVSALNLKHHSLHSFHIHTRILTRFKDINYIKPE